MNGAGNDFMVMDARDDENRDFSALAKEYCTITGADGFMAVGKSDVADFRLHFYNADGTRGEMCGNGARCICHFANLLGVAGDTMRVQTDAGIVEGWKVTQQQYRVKLNNPGVLDLQRTADAAYVELGCPGVPHSVTQLPGLDFDQKEQLRERAKQLRFHPAFPKGVNVNFYTWLDDTTIRILTYERGVEDYTLACGTGTGSTAAALWAAGKLPGGKLVAKNPGGELIAAVEAENGQITRLLLQGPTEITEIFEI